MLLICFHNIDCQFFFSPHHSVGDVKLFANPFLVFLFVIHITLLTHFFVICFLVTAVNFFPPQCQRPGFSCLWFTSLCWPTFLLSASWWLLSIFFPPTMSATWFSCLWFTSLCWPTLLLSASWWLLSIFSPPQCQRPKLFSDLSSNLFRGFLLSLVIYDDSFSFTAPLWNLSLIYFLVFLVGDLYQHACEVMLQRLLSCCCWWSFWFLFVMSCDVKLFADLFWLFCCILVVCDVASFISNIYPIFGFSFKCLWRKLCTDPFLAVHFPFSRNLCVVWNSFADLFSGFLVYVMWNRSPILFCVVCLLLVIQ